MIQYPNKFRRRYKGVQIEHDGKGGLSFEPVNIQYYKERKMAIPFYHTELIFHTNRDKPIWTKEEALTVAKRYIDHVMLEVEAFVP